MNIEELMKKLKDYEYFITFETDRYVLCDFRKDIINDNRRYIGIPNEIFTQFIQRVIENV